MDVLKLTFGTIGKKSDAFGIRFYGEIGTELGVPGSISKMVFDPDVSPTMNSKRITVWFNLEKIQPYMRILNHLDKLKSLLRNEGYAIMMSSLDELADTTLPEYANTLESNFPPSDRLHGYNAAASFSVTVEKKDGNLKFSRNEIEKIQALATKFGENVYGRSLKLIR